MKGANVIYWPRKCYECLLCPRSSTNSINLVHKLLQSLVLYLFVLISSTRWGQKKNSSQYTVIAGLLFLPILMNRNAAMSTQNYGLCLWAFISQISRLFYLTNQVLAPLITRTSTNLLIIRGPRRLVSAWKDCCNVMVANRQRRINIALRI